MKFSASRLSEGNKIFPAEIHIEQNGVTVKIPGLFGGDTKFFDFKHIASVDVKAPMIGYSTVTFYAGRTQISAHGFTSSEVKQMKQAIENGKSNASVSNSGSNDGNGNVTKAPEFLSTLIKSLDESEKFDKFDKEEEFEREEKLRLERKVEDIAIITFGSTTEEISNQLSHLVTVGSSKPDKNVKRAIVEKMEFGIMKLKGLGASVEANFFEKKLEPLKKKTWF